MVIFSCIVLDAIELIEMGRGWMRSTAVAYLPNDLAILGGQPIASTYIALMASKIALFALMLALAALHRFRLVPAVDRSTNLADKAVSLGQMRTSMAIDLVAAALILVLVAWLGTMEPVW